MKLCSTITVQYYLRVCFEDDELYWLDAILSPPGHSKQFVLWIVNPYLTRVLLSVNPCDSYLLTAALMDVDVDSHIDAIAQGVVHIKVTITVPVIDDKNKAG